jgi:hypothetical protein
MAKRWVAATGGSRPHDGQSGTQRQQSGGVRAGCWPVGQAAQRTLSQLVRLVSTGTHLQQFGALRDGVCPSAQAAQRTVEQSIFAASVAVPIDPDDVPDEPPMVDESPVVVVVAVPLDPLIVPSVPVCPVPVPVQAASARRAAIHIADSVRIHDLFMRPPLSATLVFKAA